jgi:hypothetical protein
MFEKTKLRLRKRSAYKYGLGSLGTLRQTIYSKANCTMIRPEITKPIPKRSLSSSVLSAVLQDEGSTLPAPSSLGSGIKELRGKLRRASSLLPGPRISFAQLPPSNTLNRHQTDHVGRTDSVALQYQGSLPILTVPSNVEHRIVDLLDIEDALAFSATCPRYKNLHIQLSVLKEFVKAEVTSLSSFKAMLVKPMVIKLDGVPLPALSALADKAWRKQFARLPSHLLQMTPMADLLSAMNDFCHFLVELEDGQCPRIDTNLGQFYCRLTEIQKLVQSASTEQPMSLVSVQRNLQRALTFCSLLRTSPEISDDMLDI